MEPLRLKTRAQMADAIMRLTQAGQPHHVPLLRAAMAGDLRVCFVAAGQRMPLRLLDMVRDRRPLVVVLADDGLHPAGPAGYPQARRLMGWAASIVIHAAAGEAWHYAAVAEATRLCGRVLLVETCTAHQGAWVALKAAVAPRCAGLVLKVAEGKPAHPCMTAPAGVVVQ